MKKYTLFLALCISSFSNAQPNAGIYDSYITVGGIQYYLGYSALPTGFTTNVNNAPAFNDVNFGSFTSSSILKITESIVFTFRGGNGNTGNVCGNPAIYYAVFPIGTTAGYGSFPLPNLAALAPNINNYYRQSWDDTTNINVLSGLSAGTYSFQVYAIAAVNFTGTGTCNDSAYANGLPDTIGTYYTASFTIIGPTCPPGPATGVELITNGDFSAGNTGFTTGYIYTPAPTTGNNTQPGDYWIGPGSEVTTWNSTMTTNIGPSGSSTENFMMVAGNSVTTGLTVWSETVNVVPNTVYIFSFYLCSMDAISPANLYFYVNGSAFGGETSAPSVANVWIKVTKAWCSGSDTNVTLSIIDSNQVKIGNDFGLDSISLRSSASITNISAGSDTTICNGNSVQLNPTPGACEYNWIPSSGLNDNSIQNPIASPSVTTTYTLLAIVPGCTNDTLPPSSVIITVNENTPVSAGINTSLCAGNGIVLQGSSGFDTYSWAPTIGLSNASIADPTATPTATTTYTLTATSGACSGTASVVITIGNFMPSILPADTALCRGYSAQLIVNVPTTSVSWSPAVGLSNPDIANPIASPATNTTYTATISNSGGCTATASAVVNVISGYVSGQISANPDTICPDATASLTLAGNSSDAIQWQSSANSTSVFTSIPGATNTSYTSDILNNSTYYRVIVGTGACADTSYSPFEIYVISPPSTKFSFFINGLVVTFTVSDTTGITSCSWNFGDGSTPSGAENPVHTYDSVLNYVVCLTVSNKFNCNFTNCENIGCFGCGINNIANDNTWLIYPDPFSAMLYISTGTAAVKAQRVEVFDVLGRRVYLATDVTANPIKIDLTGLVTGACFVRIITQQGDFVKKVMKE